VISIIQWRGRDLIRKQRLPKGYRRPEIDERIRRSRTLHEARVMKTLSENGVPVPLIFFLDTASSSIFMQRIVGVELRELLEKDHVFLGERLGRIAGLTHELSISHGDLTLSNIMVGGDDGLWLIDFGLSLFNATLEDMAVDVHLLERSVESTLPWLKDSFMEKFLEGYRSVVGYDMDRKIWAKVAEIRRRGRYVERTIR
jgi:TP53 regulating kinase-like protein